MQEIVDSLDAMPERSFMKIFVGVKVFEGLSGTLRQQVWELWTSMHIQASKKGRDLNRQLVQLRSAAEIEKFRKDLAPYKTDPSTAMIAQKLDQIATLLKVLMFHVYHKS